MEDKKLPDYLVDLNESKYKVVELRQEYKILKEKIWNKLQIIACSEVMVYISKVKEKKLKHALRGMFIEGKVLSSGGGYNSLIKLCGVIELGNQFSNKAKPLNKKFQSMAAYDISIIMLYFDLLNIYKDCYFEHTVFELSKFFSKTTESNLLVVGMMRAQKEAILEIQNNPEFYSDIRGNVDDWGNVYRKKTIELEEEYIKAVTQLNKISQPLKQKYKTNSEIAEILQIGERTYMGAKNGTVPIETIQSIIQKIKNLDNTQSHEKPLNKISAVEILNEAIADLKEINNNVRTKTDIVNITGIKKSTLNDALNAKYSVEAINKITDKVRDCVKTQMASVNSPNNEIKEVLLKHGGKNSDRGVHFCCMLEDYELIDFNIDEDLILATKKAAATFRACLNATSKLPEDKREKIRKILTPDVEESYLSIQAWSFDFPGRLKDHINATRNTFNKVEKSKK